MPTVTPDQKSAIRPHHHRGEEEVRSMRRSQTCLPLFSFTFFLDLLLRAANTNMDCGRRSSRINTGRLTSPRRLTTKRAVAVLEVRKLLSGDDH